MMQIALCFAAVFMATQLFAFRADEPVSGPAKATMTTARKTAPQKTPTDDQRKAVKTLDGAKVEWDAKTGAPASIRGKNLADKNLGGKGLSLSPKNDFAVDAVAVMDRLTKAYRLHDASAEFKPLKTEADELGFHHVRMNQMYQGLSVVGGQLIVHFNKSGQAYQVNGRYIPGIDVETKAVIDPNSAVAAARRDLVQMGKPAGNLKGTAELVVYAQDVAPVLAYELTLVYNDEKAGPGNWRYWINARDGSVINRFNDIRKAQSAKPKADATITGSLLTGEGGSSTNVTGDSSGAYYYLRYTTHHWEIYDYPNNRTARNSTASWPTTTSGKAEMSAAYNFDFIQIYYLNIHSRNSYDNSGANATANVHVSGDTDNAYWDPDAQAFFFYPGSMFGELTVLDVCAHEFTHAVTEYTANLVYEYESGALNESFSDIFGTTVEFASQPDGRSAYPDRVAGSADWLIGEDCTYPYDVALRDMRDPQRYDNPSKYHGTHWYYGSSDNGGVHYNSGVQNHFFYLLSEGGTGNNDGISYAITGIGVSNAANVAYRALTVYCTLHTDYAAARTAWISATTDLNASWVTAVQAAWAAVGVDSSTPTHSSNLRVQGLNNDFDNDDIGDYALFNCQYGNWYIWSSLSSDWLANGEIFGNSNYLPVPGDYNGDGKTDVVIYSRPTGWWMVYYTGTGVATVFQWGGVECIPAPGDYDGDGKTDFALYNYITGAWYIFASSTRTMLTNGDLFGGYGYIPVPGDYNGSGKSDVVVYSEELALWLIHYTENGLQDYCDFSGVFGSYRYYVPAPGDYDGDCVTDFGLYDYLFGYWYVWSPVSGWLVYEYLFADYDGYYYSPVAGDYDGDGVSDLAVYSRYYGDWYFYYMGNGSAAYFSNFGGSQFVPIIYWALYWYM